MTIAAISTALHEIIAAAIGQGVMGSAVRLGPPRPVEPGETEVNICFYRIEPNAAWRNRPMASRTGGGFASVETPSAFDLHYLIAFRGRARQADHDRRCAHGARGETGAGRRGCDPADSGASFRSKISPGSGAHSRSRSGRRFTMSHPRWCLRSGCPGGRRHWRRKAPALSSVERIV